jgi:hypothetical protein
MARSATELFGLGALASGAGALLWGARPVVGQGGDDDELHKMTGQGGHGGQGAVFPGAAGKPGQLDALTYPPPAEPAQAGRIHEFDLVAEATELEVAEGVMFHAHHSGSVELGWMGFFDVVELQRTNLRGERNIASWQHSL